MTKYEPHEVERYLADQLPEHERALRRVVAIVSDAIGSQPVISYQILGWRHAGKFVLYVSGWKDHLSIHGQSRELGEMFGAEHPEWFKLKGTTLWFQAEPELPEDLIRDLVAARLARG